MKRQQHSTEEISAFYDKSTKIRRVDAVCRDRNISKAIFHRWRRKYDGMAQALAISQNILSLLR